MHNVEIIKGIVTKLKVTNDEYRITNSKGDFYSKEIIIPKNYDLETNSIGYRTVPYSVWGQTLKDELPKNEVEEINGKINEVKTVNTKQNEVIQNMMMDILDLMYPDDSE